MSEAPGPHLPLRGTFSQGEKENGKEVCHMYGALQEKLALQLAEIRDAGLWNFEVCSLRSRH